MDGLPHRPWGPGEPAPDFTLPAINRDGVVALDQFRGKGAVLVGLFRGLHCPFCRRHLAALNMIETELRGSGVETVAVVNTPADRARLYYRARPSRLVLASDPEATTHHAFGLGEAHSDESPLVLRAKLGAMWAMNVAGGYMPTAVDRQVIMAHGNQLVGQFLIDRDGIVRWSFAEDPTTVARFPTPGEFIAAARQLAH